MEEIKIIELNESILEDNDNDRRPQICGIHDTSYRISDNRLLDHDTHHDADGAD